MPWLKLLHISAVILWCGALLYLPVAITAAAGPAPATAPSGRRLLRQLFTLVATPMALVAIASGTAIFVFRGPLSVWLIVKLAAVAFLVLAHAACGMLLLRVERDPGERVGLLCGAVSAATLLLLGCIAWLVLRKPFE